MVAPSYVSIKALPISRCPFPVPVMVDGIVGFFFLAGFLCCRIVIDLFLLVCLPLYGHSVSFLPHTRQRGAMACAKADDTVSSSAKSINIKRFSIISLFFYSTFLSMYPAKAVRNFHC